METITEIKGFKTQCPFCEQVFFSIKPHQAIEECQAHKRNNCEVLKILCMTKGMEYPIKDGGNGTK